MFFDKEALFMKIAKTLLFAFTLMVLPMRVDAEELLHELKLGLLHHDTGGLWSGFNREGGADVNAELIFNTSQPLWGGDVRPAIGASINSSGDTSKAYGAAKWETALGESGFFSLGVGAAVHTGDTKLESTDRKALGSKILFYFPIEAGYRINEQDSVSVFFDHVSNAWLASPNEGMDTLGIRYGYRF